MADVHVDDLRLPDWVGKECTITFLAPHARDEKGNDVNLLLSVTIENGDFKGIIDGIKADGGVWLPTESGVIWYMPWPPAAIRIMQSEK